MSPPQDGPAGGEDVEAQGGSEARGLRNTGQCFRICLINFHSLCLSSTWKVLEPCVLRGLF